MPAEVTCADCGRRYLLTPDDDLYLRNRDGKRVCLACLLEDAGLENAPLIEMELDRSMVTCLRLSPGACTPSRYTLKNSLKSIQDAVGGYIEVIPLGPDTCLVINEDGKMRDLPRNDLATEYFGSALMAGDYFVGEVLCFGTTGADFSSWPGFESEPAGQSDINSPNGLDKGSDTA